MHAPRRAGGRGRDRAGSRFAMAGLALAITVLAGFGLWTEVRITEAARLVGHDSGQQTAWEEARYQLAVADALQYQLLYRPEPQTRERLRRAGEQLDRALANAASAAEDDDDGDRIGDARAAIERYLSALNRELAALDGGEHERALAVHRAQARPALDQLSVALDEGARGEQAQVSEKGNDLATLGDSIAVVSPLVAIFGLVLLVVFGLLLLGYQRRIEAHALEREHDALHDALTGLPNRVHFSEHLRTTLDAAERGAVLLLDLDRFKDVNDTLGHRHGDALLQQVAERLRAVLGPGGNVARLGGDEFAVLLAPVDGLDDAGAVARRLLVRLAEPVTVDGLELETGASVGIAVWPDHGTDADELIRRADVAMYAAKHAHTGVTVYEPAHDEHTPRRLSLLAELRRAIDQDELVLHYQPQVDLRSGLVLGVEALVRWQHPTDGLLGPGEFLPLAEHTGLIEPLTTWVLRAALDRCGRLRQTGSELTVAVNLSTASLLNHDLPGEVGALLDTSGLPADALVVEITESTIMSDATRALGILSELHERGIQLAIDDFGTGYSSMAYLSAMPVDELKIDRSFVARMRTSHSDQAIVRSTVELAHSLGLRVVAEGVEDEATSEDLASLGCDALQGFWLARPMPAAELDVWLRGRDRVDSAAAPLETA